MSDKYSTCPLCGFPRCVALKDQLLCPRCDVLIYKGKPYPLSKKEVTTYKIGRCTNRHSIITRCLTIQWDICCADCPFVEDCANVCNKAITGKALSCTSRLEKEATNEQERCRTT